MAFPVLSSATELDAPPALAIDGRLVAAVELRKFPNDYQPFRHLWLFRSAPHWTLLTVARQESWFDDGSANLERCSARASLQSFTTIDDLTAAIRSRYGELGWRELLDAAASDDQELFRVWAPNALERDLLRATFYRPDLVGHGALGRTGLYGLADEVIAHLEDAGFCITDIDVAERANPNGERNCIAVGSVQRYGCEADIVVRIDPVGELYTRVEEHAGQLAIRPLEDHDA